MCGIYGIVNGQEVSPSEMIRRLGFLSHRGPDDMGIFQDKNIALGQRRLSIIDLAGGHQPLHNEDSSLWGLCNGEIYNYGELTELLKSQGHQFYTKSDSEVILHLYEQYQEKCVEYLNGIFAFAIWDQRKKKVFVVRDHLGVKPVFYYADDEILIFGSEIKIILQDPRVGKKVNLRAINHFLSLNYTPSPFTTFENIHSLPAGHYLVYENHKVKLSKYWDVSFVPQKPLSETALAEELRTRVERSVQRQMVSDVPVGSFLSGGLDSTIISKFAAKSSPYKMKTFHVRFQEDSFDESAYAALSAEDLGTEHFEIFCSAEDYKKNISKIVWHADNLNVDISMLPLFLVSQLARQHVKVVLSGDGADELFGGYPTYAADNLLAYYQKFPYFMRRDIIPWLVNALPVSDQKMSFEFKAKRFIQGANLSPEQAHCAWRLIFSDHEKKKMLINNQNIFLPDTFSAVSAPLYAQAQSWEQLSRFQYVDIKGWMVDSILSKVDLMSMANALEVRVPFLDRDLVAFASGIPAQYKGDKYILKKAVEQDLPKPILQRKKFGFNIPIGKWLRQDLKDLLTDVLTESRVKETGFLNWAFIEEILEEHLSGKRDHGYKLLGLMHLGLWYDRFIKT